MPVQCLTQSSTHRILPKAFTDRNSRGFRLWNLCREILLIRSCSFIAQGRHPIRWIVIDIHATNNEAVRFPGSQGTSLSSAARNCYYLCLTSEPGSSTCAKTIPMKIDSRLQTIRITDGLRGREFFLKEVYMDSKEWVFNNPFLVYIITVYHWRPL